MTEESIRTWELLGGALVATALIVLFFSGIFPVEEMIARKLATNPCILTAAVLPTDVISLTNDNRTDDGLPSLSISPLLMEAAQKKANDMAARSYYAHVSPDGKTPLYWLTSVGYKYLNAGENLVIDRTTAEQVVDAWMDSPDHRENILRPQFSEVGVGVAEGTFEGQDTIYVVQEFGTPYPTAPIAIATQPSRAIRGSSSAVSGSTTRVVGTTVSSTTSSPTQAVIASSSNTIIQAANVVSAPIASSKGSVAIISTPIAKSLSIASLVPVVHTNTAATTTPEPTPAATTIATTSDVEFFLPLTSADPIALLGTEQATTSTANCST